MQPGRTADRPESRAVSSTSEAAGRSANIATRLSESARQSPWQRAVVFPETRDRAGRVAWTHLTFEQLDRDSDRCARGLVERGLQPGQRIVLMVRPGLDFILLTFALFKAGAVVVLIDPGMGRSNIFRCLEEVEPHGFVGIPLVQLIRAARRRLFPQAKLNITAGRPNVPGTVPLDDVLGGEWTPFETVQTAPRDPAAIIFTSGSTGPPKGVLYEHGMFAAQVDLLREHYAIEPGEIDLPGFPLFALFNSAMGVTTVIPDMDPTRPAQVDPAKIIEAITAHGVTQAFGSPAIWNRVGRYCEEHGLTLPSLRRVLSAGAPVPLHVIERMRKALPPGADIHTPYGATESLPTASICGREVMEDTARQSRLGAGTCVGQLFPRVEVRIIPVSDEPIADISECKFLPAGEIGEILVRAPSTTRAYFRREEPTRLAKIPDGDTVWHRMGDVGWLDETGRLWFCGRKAHIVTTAGGPLYTIRCEAIFNEHPQVYRSALVGLGPAGSQKPVIVVEPEDGHFPRSAADRSRFTRELRELAAANEKTAMIETVLFHPSLPVDIRHNVKIFREKLVPWAEKSKQLKGSVR